jgi:hypothetical protein
MSCISYTGNKQDNLGKIIEGIGDLKFQRRVIRELPPVAEFNRRERR